MARAFLLLAAAVLNACDSGNEPITASEIAIVDARVHTVNDAQPWAEAVHILEGEIVYVGTTSEVEARVTNDAQVIRADGALVLPGLHDVHAHPLEAASPFSGTCILDSQEIDPERFIGPLRNCAPDQPVGDWVLGFGHSIFTLLDATRPPIEILDEAVSDRPVAIMEETSHSVWVNSRALQTAGIGPDTPNPRGGVIGRDQNGQPTGLLYDAAGDMVLNLAWPPTPEVKELNYQGLVDALGELSQNGITSVAEGRTYWKREFQDAWLRAEREGELTVRATLNLWAYPGDDDATQLATLQALHRDDPTSLVRINQIKVYADGILINTTAAMLAPYREVLPDIPGTTGLNYFPEARLGEYIRTLGPVGFDFHIHAIGDRGVREALNAIEANPVAGARHRLTHLEVVDPADYARFSALHVIADMQVAGAFSQPDAWAENEPLIGDRASPLIPLRDLHDAGARITLSSDWDVSPLSPFTGMQNALTRRPQHLDDLADVVRAYTLDAAYALRQDDRTGSIEVGKRADLVMLDRDIFAIPASQVGATRVNLTLLDGRVVFQR